MKKISIISLLLFTVMTKAQVHQIKNRVWVQGSDAIKKSVEVMCNYTLVPNDIVKEAKEINDGTKTFTVTHETTIAANTVGQQKKTVKITLPDLYGWASLKVDETKKSVLHINYYLNGFHRVPAHTRIRIIENTITCDKQVISVLTESTLATEQEYNLTMIGWKKDIRKNNKENFSDTLSTWFKTAPKVIVVFNKKHKIDYILVDKFDRTGDYTLNLENRDYISYWNTSYDIGAVNVPFIFRKGYTSSGGIKVDDDFSPNVLTLGIYGGPTVGKYRMRLEGDELKELSRVRGTIGPFVSVRSMTIDSGATSAAITPLEKDRKVNMGVLSVGGAITGVFYNIQVGFFVGVDYGFGEHSGKWNFNKKPWFGFGIGYALSSFWKKD